MNKKMRLGLALSLPLIMTACTTVPKDNGIAQVQELLDESQATYDLKMRIDLESPMSAEEITAILSAPLNIADAERMSLHANPEVQANLIMLQIIKNLIRIIFPAWMRLTRHHRGNRTPIIRFWRGPLRRLFILAGGSCRCHNRQMR